MFMTPIVFPSSW